MKTYLVRNLIDEKNYQLEINNNKFSVKEIEMVVNAIPQGFFLSLRDSPDFIVAEHTSLTDGFNVPDWSKSKLIGLGGRLFHDEMFDRATIFDLIFARRVRLFSKDKCIINKWYRPGFWESLLPSDPLIPWGNDLYKYIFYQINKYKI